MGPSKNNKTYTFALWNTMIKDIIELNGYDIQFLRTKLFEEKEEIEDIPDIIPYITNFSFEKNGGIKGNIYNLPGINDGSIIYTDSLYNVYNTLPKGYIQTKNSNNDNSIVYYELGYYALDNDNDDEDNTSSFEVRSSMLLKSFTDSTTITTTSINNVD